jgi:hypothetical protein
MWPQKGMGVKIKFKLLKIVTLRDKLFFHMWFALVQILIYVIVESLKETKTL